MKLDTSGAGIEARIRTASEMTDLRPQHRLAAKIDMSGEAIARRIKAASGMLALCRDLAATVQRREGLRSKPSP